MKKGLTQICLGRDSLIWEALQLCREVGYQGLEILPDRERVAEITATMKVREQKSIREINTT